MTESTEASTPDDEFVARVLRYQEKSLSAGELAELNDDLRNNPGRLAQFISICQTSRLIREAQSPPHRKDSQKPRPRAMLRRLVVRRLEHVSVAALLILCVGFSVLLWRKTGVDARPISQASDSVATLVRVDDDAVFSNDHEMPRSAGQELGKGWMRLERGEIQVEFRSGAMVDVQGPAVFGIDSPLRAFLEYGCVKVHAPEEARGFVVATSNMDVVDLGTRFDLAVDQTSGHVKVHVTEGLVDLHMGGDPAQPRIHSLPAGLSAQVDESGQVISIEGSPADPQQQAASSLLAHWTLDDVTENGKVLDSSGNELHGALDMESSRATIAGKVGRAFDLRDGQYVDISKHAQELTETRSFTFSAWICDSKNIIFSVSDGTPRNRVQFEVYRNHLLYGWQRGPEFDDIRAKASDWAEGQWYHVAVSVSGGTVTIYRDGLAIMTRSTGSKLGSRTMAISDINRPAHAHIGFLAKNPKQLPQYLRGKIDDVQFYRIALDAKAIRYLYENPGSTWSGVDASFVE